MVAAETITLAPERVRWAHEERERAAEEAWREPAEPPPPPPPEEPKGPPGGAAGCRASLELLAGLLVMAKREPVDAATLDIATMLIEPAWSKYGGDIPYATEIMAAAGLYLIYKASEPKPKPKPAAKPAPASSSSEAPRAAQEHAHEHEEFREELAEV